MPVEADVAGEGSIISDGTHEELDVAVDETMFEQRIVSAKLQPEYFAAMPTTFLSLDFFQHDTQATPMRQGLSPEYDFTAQYVLTVDDLFLHYISTTSLTLEVHQSWGVEAQMVARADCPLRELLQGASKVSKVAQLFATVGAPAGGAKVVGSLVYEMRMRRRVDVAVHAFLQRFPEVAELALAPVLPGARTKEAVITIRSARNLRLRAHGNVPAPYVLFEFFNFGDHETAAAQGKDPVYEQEFRFPVDMSADFVEYLKQASMRLAVFDDNERDTTAILGAASLLLAVLLEEPSVTRELPLQDVGGRAAGALTHTVELRDAAAPKPINLTSGAATSADADTAAVAIQAAIRGRAARPGRRRRRDHAEGGRRWRSPRRRSRRTR